MCIQSTGTYMQNDNAYLFKLTLTLLSGKITKLAGSMNLAPNQKASLLNEVMQCTYQWC